MSDYEDDGGVWADEQSEVDPTVMRQANQEATDFIKFKATLIREYSRRKDALRKQYRHRQLSEEQLLAQYTALVNWYVDTRRDLQSDFPDHEWEIETRSIADVQQLARTEVAALIELRRAGPAALSGGSSISDGYMHTLYGGGGGPRRSGRIRQRSTQKKPFTGPSADMVGHDIELNYTDNGGGWWTVTVVDYDENAKQHTVVGREDNGIIGRYHPGGDNSSLDELRQIARSPEENEYYTTVLNLHEHEWRVPASSQDDDTDPDYRPEDDAVSDSEDLSDTSGEKDKIGISSSEMDASSTELDVSSEEPPAKRPRPSAASSEEVGAGLSRLDLG